MPAEGEDCLCPACLRAEAARRARSEPQRSFLQLDAALTASATRSLSGPGRGEERTDHDFNGQRSCRYTA